MVLFAARELDIASRAKRNDGDGNFVAVQCGRPQLFVGDDGTASFSRKWPAACWTASRLNPSSKRYVKCLFYSLVHDDNPNYVLGCEVFVGKLPKYINESHIFEIFSRVGRI